MANMVFCRTDNNETVRVLNMIDYLDELVEWVQVSKDRTIYYWPFSVTPGQKMILVCSMILKWLTREMHWSDCGERKTVLWTDEGL